MSKAATETDSLGSAPENAGAARGAAAWRCALASLAIGSIAVVALYFGGFASAVSVWAASDAHRFLFLVPPLAAYFVWLRRTEVARTIPRPSALGLIYAAAFGFLALVSQAADLTFGAVVAAVGMLQASFLAILGWRVCRTLLFPLLFLWLMVPIGDSLTAPLIELTTALTLAGVHLAGMPAVADGAIITVRGARYAIVEQCSALDFIIGNLIISLVFAELMFHRISKRIVYVVASLPVAILANGVRTSAVILITDLTDRRVDLASDHQLFGWVVFLLAVMAQMAIGLRFRDTGKDQLASVRSKDARNRTAPGIGRFAAALCVLVLIAAAAPAYEFFAFDRMTAPVAVRLCLPATLASARPPPDDPGVWRPVFPHAHAQLHRVLDTEERPVDVFVAYYGRQGPGGKLIAWDNRLSDGLRWRHLASGTEAIRLDGRKAQIAIEYLGGPDRRRRLVWYWYWVDGRVAGNAVLAKLYQAEAALLAGEPRAAFVAVATDIVGSRESARAVLQSALDRNPGIGEMLRGAATGDAERRPCP